MPKVVQSLIWDAKQSHKNDFCKARMGKVNNKSKFVIEST